jgi:hypothetical protein
MKLSVEKYKLIIDSAINHFWDVRNSQLASYRTSNSGNRGAVTGGKQLNGFIDLIEQVAIDMGVPQNCVFKRGNQLPGFFRPTKDWDILIITPKKKLITVVEFKSQVGSFGNNFNNRTEEAIGSAVDLWTAFRENAFPNQKAPWVGYLMIIEKSPKSESVVRITEPHFKVFDEFQNTSYIDRYKLLCNRLMLERHYSATSLVWTSKDRAYGDISSDLSVTNFLYSLMGHLQGNLNEFE